MVLVIIVYKNQKNEAQLVCSTTKSIVWSSVTIVDDCFANGLESWLKTDKDDFLHVPIWSGLWSGWLKWVSIPCGYIEQKDNDSLILYHSAMEPLGLALFLTNLFNLPKALWKKILLVYEINNPSTT